MRTFIAFLFVASAFGQGTRVHYPEQVSLGPLYVSQSLAGLPTSCIADTPYWIVGNALYQNQAKAPACNWVSVGFLAPGTPGMILKYLTSTSAGSSGIKDDGTTISTTEKVSISGATTLTGPTTTIQVFSTTGALPTTGCTQGQLAIVLAASISGQIYETSAPTGTCAWSQQGGAGGGATIAVTTNLIAGDNTGNGVSSGIAPSTVIVSTGSYSNPGWLTSIAATKISGILPIANGGTGTATPGLVAGANIIITGPWPNQTIAASAAGGGGTIANTTNILKGDGAGNAVDAGIGAGSVVVTSGAYTDPTWIVALSAGILTSGTLPCGRLPTFTGDVTNVSCAMTVSQLNGAAIPASANGLSSNSAKQLVASTAHNNSVPANCAGSNSATAAACATSPTFSITSGDMIRFVMGTIPNSGAYTVAINGGAPLAVKKRGCSQDLSANDLTAGYPVDLYDNGTNLCVMGDVANLTTGAAVLIGDGAGGFSTANGARMAQPLLCNGNSGGSDTGTAMTCNTPPSFIPGVGTAIYFNPALANSGSVTLNVNSAGPQTIKKQGGTVNLAAGDLSGTNQWVILINDGTNWQMESQPATAPGTGTVTSVGQTVPSWLTVTGSPVTGAGTLAISAAGSQTSHQVIGTCGSFTSFAPCPLGPTDLPTATGSSLGIVRPDGTTITISGGVLTAVSSGTGTVTNVGLTVPSWLSVAGSPVTTSGTLAVTPTAAQPTGKVIGTCGSATSFGPCSLTMTDLPSGIGTVSSVGILMPTAVFNNGSPITNTGNLSASFVNQSASTFFAGAATGGATTPSFRTMAASDVPSNLRARAIGVTFGAQGGTPLTAGQVVYVAVPFSCSIAAWSVMVDTGTVTVDVWKTGAGTSVPTVTNSIAGSALPSIATGTANVGNTTLTGWTTAVSKNDIMAFAINAATGPTTATAEVECDQ